MRYSSIPLARCAVNQSEEPATWLRTKPRRAEKIQVINSLTGTTGRDAGGALGLVPKYYRKGERER